MKIDGKFGRVLFYESLDFDMSKIAIRMDSSKSPNFVHTTTISVSSIKTF